MEFVRYIFVPRDQFLATGVTRTQSSTAVCENSPSSIFSSLFLRGRSKCSTVPSLVCLRALSQRDLTSTVSHLFQFCRFSLPATRYSVAFLFIRHFQGTSDTCNTRATPSRCAGKGSSAWRCRRVQEHVSLQWVASRAMLAPHCALKQSAKHSEETHAAVAQFGKATTVLQPIAHSIGEACSAAVPSWRRRFGKSQTKMRHNLAHLFPGAEVLRAHIRYTKPILAKMRVTSGTT